MSAPLIDDPELEAGSFDAEAFAGHALASPQNLAAVLDHTLLKPEATRDQVAKLCREAAEYRFACAMVNPVWAAFACSELAGSGVPAGVVIGFPLGASLATTKRDETAILVRLGAHDIDMVLNIGLLRSGDNRAVQQDIRGVAEIAHDAGAIVKVILETCLLNVEEKLRASELAIAAGADFLKTSTGFSTGGATPEDIALMRGVAGSRCGIKASGGIRTLDDARRMLSAGASRIGASASVAIVRELTQGSERGAQNTGGY
ncbi:deoxyribose-phosphate aldolase [Paracidobacterium acidisoli]|uniref:Deoxyribose-phosphate aldolase n=1 Tax=Paracidobacterium acidisoli TaxID=2303751 RepID=A0A372ISC8_9BACT|nr:deoxyribose-phosphate aldolase [Paracidobacterium acidisoli]MBT9330718.1 deoxyribose-phosphate aldolase [Paracidobacterium acidisoli]